MLVEPECRYSPAVGFHEAGDGALQTLKARLRGPRTSFLLHFVVRGKSQAKPDLRGRKTDFTSCCEEQDACTEMGESVGGHIGDSTTGVDQERWQELCVILMQVRSC